MPKAHPYELAVNEQLKTRSPEDGLCKGRPGKRATREQLMGYRRSTEKILIDMVDRISVGENRAIAEKVNWNDYVNTKDPKKKRRKKKIKILTLYRYEHSG